MERDDCLMVWIGAVPASERARGLQWKCSGACQFHWKGGREVKEGVVAGLGMQRDESRGGCTDWG